MSCILHIETSTDVCSVALSQDGVCIYSDENREGPEHARILAPFVSDAISFADSHAIPIDAVAVSKGPGSYTGLRIGVSTAKGVCYARDLRLISVSTLALLSVPILLRHELEEDALLCPMIDARRMEVYCCLYDRALRTIEPTSAQIITPDSFATHLNEHPVYFFGNGAEKCKGVITHPNAHFIEGIVPLAKYMFPLAEKAVATESYEDVAYFEPFYLKQFVAQKPKNLL